MSYAILYSRTLVDPAGNPLNPRCEGAPWRERAQSETSPNCSLICPASPLCSREADDRPASERSETTQKSRIYDLRIHRMLGLINLVS